MKNSAMTLHNVINNRSAMIRIKCTDTLIECSSNFLYMRNFELLRVSQPR